MDSIKLYSYAGQVGVWGRCVTSSDWHAETMAVSKAKAMSNLAHQFREQCNLPNNTPIIFYDEIKEMN